MLLEDAELIEHKGSPPVITEDLRTSEHKEHHGVSIHVQAAPPSGNVMDTLEVVRETRLV